MSGWRAACEFEGLGSRPLLDKNSRIGGHSLPFSRDVYSSALGNSRSSDCHHLRTTFEHGLQETKSEATKKSLEMPFEMVRTFVKLFSIPAEISLDNLLVRPQFDRETFAEADSFGEYVRCSSCMGSCVSNRRFKLRKSSCNR